MCRQLLVSTKIYKFLWRLWDFLHLQQWLLCIIVWSGQTVWSMQNMWLLLHGHLVCMSVCVCVFLSFFTHVFTCLFFLFWKIWGSKLIYHPSNPLNNTAAFIIMIFGFTCTGPLLKVKYVYTSLWEWSIYICERMYVYIYIYSFNSPWVGWKHDRHLLWW